MGDTQELRYRGELLGFHPDEKAAKAHAKKNHADVEDRDALTIEPRRAVSLYQNGSLVDTYHTQEAALTKRDQLMAARKAKPLYKGDPGLTPANFHVLSGEDQPTFPDVVDAP